jgi:hypothetical protein
VSIFLLRQPTGGSYVGGADTLSGSAFTATVDDTTGVTDAGQIRTLTATGTDTAGLTDSASSSLSSPSSPAPSTTPPA